MSLQYIETDGGRLAVEVRGSGPLIICSPGLGDRRDAYEPLAERLLAKGYTVATIDPRGHGDSSATFQRYGDEPMADDFILVAEHLKQSKVVLAGASFSAGAATIAAGRRPDLVVGIILLGPFLRNGMAPLAMSLLQIMWWRPWGSTMWQFYAATLWPGLGPAGAKERAATSTQMITRTAQHYTAFQKTFAGADHRVVEPWLSKVQASVLVVMGDKDPDFSSPKAEAEWIASQFSDVKTLDVPDAGHAPQFERPELVGENVLKFVDELKAKQAF